MKPMFLNYRPRRLRKSEAIRDLVAENVLDPKKFVQPIFVSGSLKKKQEIEAMSGIFKYSLDDLFTHIDELLSFGINSVLLFPFVESKDKDEYGSISRSEDFYYFKVIDKLKSKFPEICIMTDVALDPYTSHGHDGILEDGKILNDQTLPFLSAMSLLQAQAGADVIAPSDMMDGRVNFIRQALDNQGYSDVLIMAYTAKYVSSFYGPFRYALGSDILQGDKKTYQMDFRNGDEALREADLDVKEGADILMVKPGLAYLDIIYRFRQTFNLPIAAYNVSGEYAMLKSSAYKGWIDYEQAVVEVFFSFIRAGSSFIVSYSSLDVAKILTKTF